MADLPEIPLNEDCVFEYDLTRRNTATRKPEPFTPATGCSAWWSTTEDGAEIHADVKVSLTEAGSKPGTVYGIVQRSNMIARLTAFLGSTIYAVLEYPTGQRVSTPFKVVSIRTVPAS